MRKGRTGIAWTNSKFRAWTNKRELFRDDVKTSNIVHVIVITLTLIDRTLFVQIFQACEYDMEMTGTSEQGVDNRCLDAL